MRGLHLVRSNIDQTVEGRIIYLVLSAAKVPLNQVQAAVTGPGTGAFDLSGNYIPHKVKVAANMRVWATVLLPLALRETAHGVGAGREESPDPFTAGQWDNPTSAA